jgi:uncharacterized protein (TIGR03083 family)
MLPPEPVIVIDIFPDERRALLDLLGGLSEEEWRAPTACAGWSVKDVALHILGGDLANLSRRRDGFDPGLFAAPGVDLSRWENLVGALNRWNEAWVEAARRISPRLLIELLAFTGDALAVYFRQLDPLALGAPVSWAGPEPAPVWLDIAREYTERWTHQQQIRDAVGRPGLLDRRFFGPVLAAFVHALPVALRDAPAREGAVVRLVITGPAGGEWVAVRRRDRWTLGHAPAAPADATATLDQQAAWRLFTKGLISAEAERVVRLEGQRELAAGVLDMVSIIA